MADGVRLTITGDAVSATSAFRQISAEVRKVAGDLDKLSQGQLTATESAFKKLGLASGEALQSRKVKAEAESIRNAFETIRTAGHATTDEILKAGRAMDEKLLTLGTGATQSAGGFKALQAAAVSANGAITQAGFSTGILGQAISALTSPLGLVAVGLGAIATAAMAGVNAMVSNANEVRNLMAVSGLAADEVDNLSDTFALLGKDGDILRNAMFRMGRELEAGGAAVTKLGVNLRDGQGAIKTEAALLLDVRDAISKLGSASERSAALQNVFERSGRELADVFALSTERFKEYTAQAGRISEWNQKMQDETQDYILANARLRLEWDALLQQIGRELLPAFSAIVSAMSSIVSLARDPVNFVINLLPKGIVETLERVKALRDSFGGAVSDLLFPNTTILTRGESATGTSGFDQMTGGAVDPKLLPGEIAALKATMDGRLSVLQAGLAREQAARQAAVAQGTMTEAQAASEQTAGIERLRAAKQLAFGEEMGLLAQKGATEAEFAALSSKHTADMIGLDTQRISSLSGVARSTKGLADILTQGQQKLTSIAGAFQPEDVQRLAAVSLEFGNLAKKAEELGGKGSAVAAKLREMGDAAVGLTRGQQAIAAFVAEVKGLADINQVLGELAAKIKPLSEIETILQPLIAALEKNTTLSDASKKALLEEGTALAQQIQLKRVQKQTTDDHIASLGDEAKAWDMDRDAMRGYVEALGPFREAFSVGEIAAGTFTATMAEASLQSRILGDDFDMAGARIAALRAQFDTLVSDSSGRWTPEIQRVGEALRSALADQALYNDIERGLLSVTDTITKLVDASIAGTLKIQNVWDALRAFFLNWVQVFAHQVLDPLLKDLAQLVAGFLGVGRGGAMSGAGTIWSMLGAAGGAGVGMAGDAAFASSAEGLGLGGTPGGAGGGSDTISTLGSIGSLLTGAYNYIIAPLLKLPTLTTLAGDGLTYLGTALGILGPSATSAAAAATALSGGVVGLTEAVSAFGPIAAASIEAAASGGAFGAGAGAGAAAGASSSFAGGGIAGGLAVGGVTAFAMLPALIISFGTMIQAQSRAETMWRELNQRRQAFAMTGDVAGGLQGLTLANALEEPRLKLLQTLKAYADFSAIVPKQAEERRLAGTSVESDIPGSFYDPSTGALQRTASGAPDYSVLTPFEQSPVLKEAESLINSLTKLGVEASLKWAQTSKELGSTTLFQDAAEWNRLVVAYADALETLMGATQTPPDTSALRAAIIDSLTAQFLANPLDIVRLLDLGALAEEGEDVKDTVARMVQALGGLDSLMRTLDTRVRLLRGDLNIPLQLADNIGLVTRAMDQARQDLAAATTDPTKMLVAAQRLNDLVEARYKLEIDAITELTRLLDSYAASVSDGYASLAKAAPVLRALGIDTSGMTTQLVGVIGFLHGVADVSGEIATLGPLLATVAAEMSGADPAHILSLAGALAGALAQVATDAENLSDPQARLAALQQVLAGVVSGYESGVTALHAYYAAQETAENLAHQTKLGQLAEFQTAIDAQKTGAEAALAAVLEWERVAGRIRASVLALQTGPESPLNPADQLALVQGKFESSLDKFWVTPSADLAEALVGIGQEVIAQGLEVFSKPSPAYATLFGDVISKLNAVATFAETMAAPRTALEEQISALNWYSLSIKMATEAINVEHGVKLDAIAMQEQASLIALQAEFAGVAAQVVGVKGAVDGTMVTGYGIWGAVGAVWAKMEQTRAELVSIIGEKSIDAAIMYNTTQMAADLSGVKQSIYDSLDTLVRTRLDALVTNTGNLEFPDQKDVVAAVNLSRRVIDMQLERIISQGSKTAAPRYDIPGAQAGMWSVPYDNYLVRLHKGERVLDAEDAGVSRRYGMFTPTVATTSYSPQGGGGDIHIHPGAFVINGVTDPKKAADMAMEKWQAWWRSRGRQL